MDLPKKLGEDQVSLLVLSEAVLVVLVFSVTDDVVDRRARRRWQETSGLLIATLRLNMLITQQRMDHALRHTDQDHTWEALARSADWFSGWSRSASLSSSSIPILPASPLAS